MLKKIVKYVVMISVCVFAQAESFQYARAWRGYEAFGSEWFVFPVLFLTLLHLNKILSGGVEKDGK